jgi:hypothetical protein
MDGNVLPKKYYAQTPVNEDMADRNQDGGRRKEAALYKLADGCLRTPRPT